MTLTDEASKKEDLSKTTSAFIKFMTDGIDFQNDWGLIPYFNFRSQSEQAKLKEEVFG